MSSRADDRVMYAHNWEDPRVEMGALAIGPADEVIAIGGGGCTALSLLAQGPRHVHVVDRSFAQIHLVRLKLAAVTHLSAAHATAFLGGVPANDRISTFKSLEAWLPAATARFWNDRIHHIRLGVLTQGRIERYFAILRRVLGLVHPRRRIEALFEPRTLESQCRYYEDEWNTRGWQRLFLLGHKRILDRVLDPSFYRYVEAHDLPRELHERAGRCMTQLPVSDNYFLSWIFRGRYPDDAAARPPYLQAEASGPMTQFAGRLETHPTDIQSFLRSRPDDSCDKFYLSNVPEWLRDDEVTALFQEVVRVARDGAIVCRRALMVDRPLPSAVNACLREDGARSAAWAGTDRAFVNAGFHVATVHKSGAPHV